MTNKLSKPILPIIGYTVVIIGAFTSIVMTRPQKINNLWALVSIALILIPYLLLYLLLRFFASRSSGFMAAFVGSLIITMIGVEGYREMTSQPDGQSGLGILLMILLQIAGTAAVAGVSFLFYGIKLGGKKAT